MAQVVSAVTLVNIFTDEQYIVVAEAHGTFTAEASYLVDTRSVCTYPRDLSTLINIDGLACVDVYDEPRSLVPTQYLVLRGDRGRAGFTGLVPGFAHVVGTAAHLLGHVERQLVLTRVVEVAVTHALPHVHAVVSSVDLHVLRRTHAGVVPQGVVAGTRATDSNVGCALINILADACLLVEVVACGALTLEATEGVDTVATLAQAWQLLALINVFQDDSDGVRSEALSSGTQCLVLRGVDGGAEFTGVSPGSP